MEEGNAVIWHGRVFGKEDYPESEKAADGKRSMTGQGSRHLSKGDSFGTWEASAVPPDKTPPGGHQAGLR